MTRFARALALTCLVMAGGASCTAPCREADGGEERREFERDHERCEARARKLARNIDLGDYRSCMRVRGWCSAPGRD